MTEFNIVGDTPQYKGAVISSGLSIEEAEKQLENIQNEINANYRQINNAYDNIRIEPIL